MRFIRPVSKSVTCLDRSLSRQARRARCQAFKAPSETVALTGPARSSHSLAVTLYRRTDRRRVISPAPPPPGIIWRASRGRTDVQSGSSRRGTSSGPSEAAVRTLEDRWAAATGRTESRRAVAIVSGHGPARTNGSGGRRPEPPDASLAADGGATTRQP